MTSEDHVRWADEILRSMSDEWRLSDDFLVRRQLTSGVLPSRAVGSFYCPRLVRATKAGGRCPAHFPLKAQLADKFAEEAVQLVP